MYQNEFYFQIEHKMKVLSKHHNYDLIIGYANAVIVSILQMSNPFL